MTQRRFVKWNTLNCEHGSGSWSVVDDFMPPTSLARYPVSTPRHGCSNCVANAKPDEQAGDQRHYY